VVTRIQKWGNSQGLRLAREVLHNARLSLGDEVDVSARDGLIVIAPVRRVRGKHSLARLVAQIPRSYRAREVARGRPVGREEW